MVAMLTAKTIATPNARILARSLELDSFYQWNLELSKIEAFIAERPRLMKANSFVDWYFFSPPNQMTSKKMWVSCEITGHVEVDQKEFHILDLDHGEVFDFNFDLGESGSRQLDELFMAAQQFVQHISAPIAPTWRARLEIGNDSELEVRVQFFKLISIS